MLLVQNAAFFLNLPRVIDAVIDYFSLQDVVLGNGMCPEEMFWNLASDFGRIGDWRRGNSGFVTDVRNVLQEPISFPS